MQVTIDIPGTLADQLLATGKDPAHAALEALVVDAYRRRILFEGEIKRILGYGTRMQVHRLLFEHDVPLNYDMEEWLKDLETIKKFEEQAAFAAA